MLKTIIALAIAAGFASASFAQTGSTNPNTAPAAKVTAPAPMAAEKKVEAPKAAEPAKMDAAKTETPKAEATPAKVKKHGKKAAKAKAEAAAPAAK